MSTSEVYANVMAFLRRNMLELSKGECKLQNVTNWI